MIKNNEDAILNEIMYVLDHEKERRSFLLDGTWGIGKTYFFQHKIRPMLTQKEITVIEVSLFGLKDLESLKNKILSEYFLKLNGNSFNSLFKNVRNKIKNLFVKKDFFTNIYSIKSNFKAIKEDWYKEFILKNSFNLFFMNTTENIFICFDDCERISDKNILNEILSIVDNFNNLPNVAVLAIGNFKKINGKTNLTQYKEKVFRHSFVLEKDDDCFIDILENGAKISENFKAALNKKVKKLLASSDAFKTYIKDTKKNIAEESFELIKNVRVMTKAIKLIQRIDEIILQKNIKATFFGINKIINACLFYCVVFHSSDTRHDFEEYCYISFPGMFSGKEHSAEFYEILAYNLDDPSIKMKSIFDYFKNGYLDELELLNDLQEYIQTDLATFLNYDCGYDLLNYFVKQLSLSPFQIKKQLKKLHIILNNINYKMNNEEFKIITSLITFCKILNIDSDCVNKIMTVISKFATKEDIEYFECFLNCDDVSKNNIVFMYNDTLRKIYEEILAKINIINKDSNSLKLKKAIEGNDIESVDDLVRHNTYSDKEMEFIVYFILRQFENGNAFSNIQFTISLFNEESVKKQFKKMSNDIMLNKNIYLNENFIKWLLYIANN